MDSYELEVKKNAKRNEKFLKEFENWLIDKKLAKKTISKHLNNIEFYLNEYLIYYDIIKMEDGMYHAYEFFSDWFIRKCLWASKTSIKENASSLKKFYKCMSEKNFAKVEEYNELCEILKEEMDNFIELLDYECYNFFN